MIKGAAEIYCGRIEKFLRSVDLAKVSDADLEFLYGDKVDLTAIATKWLSLGPHLVVITKGSEGALAFYHEASSGKLNSFAVAPPATKVVDTVGAGDTCTGALLSRLLNDGLAP